MTSAQQTEWHNLILLEQLALWKLIATGDFSKKKGGRRDFSSINKEAEKGSLKVAQSWKPYENLIPMQASLTIVNR